MGEESLRIVRDLAEIAERSKQDKDFDTGLPFEIQVVEALAAARINHKAEYSRAWTKLKEAKPKPDLRLLELTIKSQSEIQKAKLQQPSITTDPVYETPVKLLKGSDYQVNKHGGLSRVEFRSVVDADGKSILIPTETPICDFVPYPVREILKDNGSDQSRYVELEGILPDGSLLQNVTVPMEEFQDMKWLGPKWGPRAAVRPHLREDLRYCIQRMSQNDIPEHTIRTHTGWIEVNGNHIFLHAGGAVGSDNQEVELPSKLSAYRLPKAVENKTDAVRLSASILDVGKHRVTYPIVSVTYLCPLTEPMRQAHVEPSFLPYLWGDSGCLKSTMSAVAHCHFGRFDSKGLPASFTDTTRGIEEMCFAAKDVLMGVEDYHPKRDPRDRQKQDGNLEYLLRNQGDRQGRNKMVKNAANTDHTLNTSHPPRGIVLSTGEMQPTIGSSLARMFAIHIHKGDIDSGKLKAIQNQVDLLPHSMLGYIEWIRPQFEEIVRALPPEFERLRDKARDEAKVKGRHGRLNEAVSCLQIGLDMFTRYAVESGVVSQVQADEISKEGWQIFNDIADEQTEVAKRGDSVRVFFESISELQAQHKVYFVPMVRNKDVVTLEQEWTGRRELIGWGPDESGVYYVLTSPVIKSVNDLLRSQGDGNGVNKNDVLDALEDRGLLETSNGKASFNKTIDGKTRWVTAIKKEAFELDGQN